MTEHETNNTVTPQPIDSTPVLLSYAYALEVEAGERYADLAEQMETHNNPEVVELFEKLARIEKLHADHVLEHAASLGISEIATVTYQWEGPETMDFGDAHYLMTPHHALKLALHNEQRAFEFFSRIAAEAADPDVKSLAEEMAGEEEEHVALMADWLAKFPPPEDEWSDDPDPPVVVD